MDLQLTSNANEVGFYFDRASKLIAPNIVKRLRRVGMLLQATIVRNVTGGVLTRRTGNTGRAVFYRVTVDEGPQPSVTVRAGVDLRKAPGARILNYGGTITPKRAQNLAIPVGAALTASGVGRGVTARQFMDSPGRLGYASAFIRKGVIFGKRQGGTIEPVFALKQSVTIPAFQYLERSRDEVLPKVAEELGLAAADAFEAAKSAAS